MSRRSGRARKGVVRSKSKPQPQGAATPSPQQSRTNILHRLPVVRALFRGGEWSRTDTLTAIGITVAIAAIITPILVSNSQSGASGPNLKVEEVEIAQASSIDASVQIPGETAPQSEKDTGSAIDITLRNSGNAPALIVDAVFSFARATELDSCPGGAGAAESSAEYDVKVPTAKPVVANHPLVLRRDMRFVVDANSIDRFRISVGPDRYSSASWPWIYQFNLSLVQDDGQNLNLGPMSILGYSQPSAGSQSWDPLRSLTQTQLVLAQQVPCVTRDAAELSQAIAKPGLHSPEFQTMYNEAKQLTANAPSCSQIPIAQNPNGCPAPSGTSTFFSDPRGVTICGATLEVVSSYNCNTVEDIMKEYEEAKASRVVSMIFTSGSLVLPMQCLPAGRAEVCRSTDTQDLVVGFIP